MDDSLPVKEYLADDTNSAESCTLFWNREQFELRNCHPTRVVAFDSIQMTQVTPVDTEAIIIIDGELLFEFDSSFNDNSCQRPVPKARYEPLGLQP